METEHHIPSHEEDSIILTKARASFYAFVNIHFTHLPDTHFINNVRNEEFRGTLDDLKQNDQVHTGIANGAALMQTFLSSTVDLTVEELKEKLGVDRTRLYRGISPNIGPPPPYEALWMGNHSDSTELLQKIAGIYNMGGFRLHVDTNERLDYIGLELDFMEQLIQKEISARETVHTAEVRSMIGIEENFLRGHLGQWVPKFIAKALKYSDTDFYRGHMHMLNGLIEEEKKVLKMLREVER